MNKLLINGVFILYNHKIKDFEIYKGNMLIKNNRITRTAYTHLKQAKIIDLNEKIVSPVFINSHLHLGETIFRPLKQKMSLLQYINYTENFNKKLNNKEKEYMWISSAKKTIKESLESGVGCVCTIRGNVILYKYPIKSFAGYPIMLSDKLIQYYKDGIRGFNLFSKDCRNKKISPGVFLHSMYTNNKESLSLAKKCHNKNKSFFGVHVAEDYESEELVIKKWKKRSLAVLNDFNLLSKKTLLVHGYTLNSDELNLIKDKKCTISICPISANNFENSLDIVETIINKEINFCIATDGLATGSTANLLEQTKVLKKRINAMALFKSITINPANFFNLKKFILSHKSYANFIVFEKCRNLNKEYIIKKIINNELLIKNFYIDGKIV